MKTLHTISHFPNFTRVDITVYQPRKCFIYFKSRIFPESVRYYLIKGKQEKARGVLERVAKYNKKPMIEDKLEQIKEKKSSLNDLFATPLIRKYTLLSCFIWLVNRIQDSSRSITDMYIIIFRDYDFTYLLFIRINLFIDAFILS